ncbi:MAG: RsmD family RNA methyltransferase [Bacteroidetes bacterium]|nr:RsmD family RNA methyltransferase [Bacteroidota bacterium]
MRIISGKFGGRKILTPAKMPLTRPTTDFAKEGLFNILQNRITLEGIKTLDLFGGTGSISLELASRGASMLDIVEKNSQMSTSIKKNFEHLGIENVQIYSMDVFEFIEKAHEKYQVIFAGPPYALNEIDLLPEKIFQKELLAPDGIFILEHTPRNEYSNFPFFRFQRNYGTTIFSFFEANNSAST